MRWLKYIIALGVLFAGFGYLWHVLSADRVPSVTARRAANTQALTAARKEKQEHEWQEKLDQVDGEEISNSSNFEQRLINSIRVRILPEGSNRDVPLELKALTPMIAQALVLRLGNASNQNLGGELKKIGVEFDGDPDGFANSVQAMSPNFEWKKINLNNCEIVYFRPQDAASASEPKPYLPSSLKGADPTIQLAEI